MKSVHFYVEEPYERTSRSFTVALLALPIAASAESGEADLAQEMTNPIAGDDNRQNISNTFMHLFVAHTWPIALTASIQSETSDNWETDKWSVPINAALSKLVKLGKVPVSLQAGVGYWAESPDNGPEGFRFRLQANVVLPK